MIKIKFDDVMIHYKPDDFFIDFEVYPIIEWTGANNTSGISYVVKDTGCETLDVFDKDKAKKLFEGSICWRGVWEGRLYFTEDEYWGDELQMMAELYKDKIVPWCQEFIKKRHPEYDYED